MNLSQLAFACYIYRRFADDGSLRALRAEIGTTPDLTQNGTALSVLKWLNLWKCRLRVADFDSAAIELASWQRAFECQLPPVEASLLELSDDDLERAASAYADLFTRMADRKRRFQATATSKVLFALRPNALPPWDEAIRRGLGFDGSSPSYLAFLKYARTELRELKDSCDAVGVDIAKVPETIYRPASTLAKLVDEYDWTTITRGFRPPDWLKLSQWLTWSVASQADALGRWKSLLDALLKAQNESHGVMVDPDALWELRETSKI